MGRRSLGARLGLSVGGVVMSDLQQALDALAQRKVAAMSRPADDAREPEVAVVDMEIYRMVWVGWDVDHEEIVDFSDVCARDMTVAATVLGLPIIPVIQSSWLDGFMTGMMLCELRGGVRRS